MIVVSLSWSRVVLTHSTFYFELEIVQHRRRYHLHGGEGGPSSLFACVNLKHNAKMKICAEQWDFYRDDSSFDVSHSKVRCRILWRRHGFIEGLLQREQLQLCALATRKLFC